MQVPVASPWWVAILIPLVPTISGILSKYGADGLKQLLPIYDNASTLVKSLVSVGLGLLVGFFNTKFTLDTGALPIDPHSWTAPILGAVFTAIFSAGLYRATKNKNLAAQGAAMMEQRIDLVRIPAAPLTTASVKAV